MRRLRALAPWAVLVVAFTMASPVSAVQPHLEAFVDASNEVIDCGDFSATLERSYEGTLAVFFDRQENPIRIQFAARLTGSLTPDGGAAIDLRGDVLVVIDLVNGTFAYDGQVLMANEPASGAIIQDTGRFLVDEVDNVLLAAGPHDAIDSGGAIFCTVLL
jgi:hypothetical protein